MNSVSMENDVNLEYGLQIINNMQQSDNSPDKNWEESDGDGDQEQIENFVDSPR